MTDVIEDRLFVPLNTDPFAWYESGRKDIELRGLSDRFNPETVLPGRPVQLVRGYNPAYGELWARVNHVHLFRHKENIPRQVDHRRINPFVTTDEFIDHVDALLGGYSQFIAFKLQGIGPELDGGDP